jgi:hypothetical protein
MEERVDHLCLQLGVMRPTIPKSKKASRRLPSQADSRMRIGVKETILKKLLQISLYYKRLPSRAKCCVDAVPQGR